MEKFSDDPKFINTKQAAESIGISSRRIRQLAMEGRLVGAFLHEREGWQIPSIVNVKQGKRGPKFTGSRKKYG
ncbi:MAG: DNA-binding protein [Marivirga sp.]|nr:DNA-binding protein [Marivirga sp.]